jgi:hypothetical protein
MNISLIKVREPSVSIPEVTPPLGIMYLASYLRKYRPNKDTIQLFDLSVQKKDSVIENMKDADIVGLSCTNRDGLYLAKTIDEIRTVNPGCTLVL